jgi:hypothetical protein
LWPTMSAATSSLSSPLVSLVLQSIGMLIGTLICGTIPLHLPLSKTKLRVLEVMGAGLLVGAGMTVVLPEGASALFKSSPESDHDHFQLAEGALTRRTMDARAEDGHSGHNHEHSPESLMGLALLGGFLVMFL